MKHLSKLVFLGLFASSAAFAQGDKNFLPAELNIGTSFGNAFAFYETTSEIGYHMFGLGYNFKDILTEGLTIAPTVAHIAGVNGAQNKNRVQLRATYTFLEKAFVRAEYRYTSGDKRVELTEPMSEYRNLNYKFDDQQRARLGIGYDFGRVKLSYDVFAHRQDNDVIAARQNRQEWTSQWIQADLNTGTGLTPFVRFTHTSDAGLAAGNRPDDKALFGLMYWF
ncbi:hypothetical protein [Paraferrimonas sedimenticola]|uniref:Uncharacterized protein n=1 Tax=Paraferrimonas sedimenticola TaxID=375674 RepID=A0AA37RUP1_9GAMM|nr:hypothetical protein [Paraferrimonas sedimenticola]GLP95541.1 hypothetical protein GCM10007895_08470 [Paraferrimonas sedimenticola]